MYLQKHHLSIHSTVYILLYLHKLSLARVLYNMV
jgi:hypothetical protein